MSTATDLKTMMHEIANREGRTDSISVVYGQFLSEQALEAKVAVPKLNGRRCIESAVPEEVDLTVDDNNNNNKRDPKAQEDTDSDDSIHNLFGNPLEIVDGQSNGKGKEQNELSDFEAEEDDIDRQAQILASATKSLAGGRKRVTSNDIASPLPSKRIKSENAKSATGQPGGSSANKSKKKHTPKKAENSSMPGRRGGNA